MIAKINNSSNPDIKDFTYIDIGEEFTIKKFDRDDVQYRYVKFLSHIDEDDVKEGYIITFSQFEAINGTNADFTKAVNKLIYKKTEDFREDMRKTLDEYKFGAKLTIRVRHLQRSMKKSAIYIIHKAPYEPVGEIAEEIIDKDIYILNDYGKTVDFIRK